MMKSFPAPFILVKASCMLAKLGGLCGPHKRSNKIVDPLRQVGGFGIFGDLPHDCAPDDDSVRMPATAVA